MSRRSPTNARYQKYTEPAGKTRKSAAAAKPTRKEGVAATSSSKPKTKADKDHQPGGRYYEPDTPEYVFWRRMWWFSIGVGLVLVAVSFAVRLGPLAKQAWSPLTGVLALGLAYAGIIAAFFIDYRVLRKMRMGTYVSKNALAEPSKKNLAKAPPAPEPEAPTADDDNDDMTTPDE